MKRLVLDFKFIVYPLILCFLCAILPVRGFAQEQITITTYYPSPSGVYRQLRWGDLPNSRGTLSFDQGSSIELGGSGVPYIDFSNDMATDFDVRLILSDNDTLGIAGGNVVIEPPAAHSDALQVTDGANIVLTAPPGASSGDPGDLIFRYNDGRQKGRIWVRSDAEELRFAAGESTHEDMRMDNDGNLWVGDSGPLGLGFIGGAVTLNDLNFRHEWEAYVPGLGLLHPLGALAAKIVSIIIINAALVGAIIDASSVRYKENVKTINDALGKVIKLRGVEFDWKELKRHDIGMIAEEVGQVFPELLTYEEDGKTIQGFRYQGLVGVLVEAIKAQQKEIVNQQELIKKLEMRIGALEGISAR